MIPNSSDGDDHDARLGAAINEIIATEIRVEDFVSNIAQKYLNATPCAIVENLLRKPWGGESLGNVLKATILREDIAFPNAVTDQTEEDLKRLPQEFHRLRQLRNDLAHTTPVRNILWSGETGWPPSWSLPRPIHKTRSAPKVLKESFDLESLAQEVERARRVRNGVFGVAFYIGAIAVMASDDLDSEETLDSGYKVKPIGGSPMDSWLLM